MAKITNKPTGRPSTSYKAKYLALELKYKTLMESKLGLAGVQKPEEALMELDQEEEEIQKIQENQILNSEAKSEEASPEAVVEENPMSEEQPKELEILEEVEEVEELKIEEEKVNPDDWDFRCSNCKELFMSEGNVFGSIVKCPDCGKEFNNA